MRCDRIPAGGATFIDVADRPGRAPLVRFGPLQHSLAAARCPADANLPDDPASAFSPPARALFADRHRRRPPVRFCARGGRGSVSLVWRAGSGFWLASVAWASFDGNPTRHELSNTLPSAAIGAGATVARSRAHRLPSPHQPAPARACLVRRGSFAAAVSRTRRSGPVPRTSATWPGGQGFFPLSARRRSWGFALRRVAPDLGWTTRGKPRG